jgi:hypothetical protein
LIPTSKFNLKRAPKHEVILQGRGDEVLPDTPSSSLLSIGIQSQSNTRPSKRPGTPKEGIKNKLAAVKEVAPMGKGRPAESLIREDDTSSSIRAIHWD